MQIFNPKCVFSATNWVASVRLRRHIMETWFLQWKMWLIITYINRKISLSMTATTMTWASSPTKKLLLWKKRLTKSHTLNHLGSCHQRKCFLANAYFYHLLVLVVSIPSRHQPPGIHICWKIQFFSMKVKTKWRHWLP